jgi:hypothetical protein
MYTVHRNKYETTYLLPVRLAGGWLLMLICPERKVLLAGW